MREGDLWIAFFMLYYGQSYRLMKDIFCRLLEDKIRRHKQFIAEIVYYLGGNLYEEIYHDVGLPLNKVYIINVPQSSICTFALYKNVNCGGCLDNE